MIGGLVRGTTAQVKSAGRQAGAVADDLLHGLDVLGVRGTEQPDDPFAFRDPDYIRDTLPNLRLSSRIYHRADVRGLENIPDEGPVLLVGNHSGGTWIVDTFVFTQAFYDFFGPERPFFQLAHDMVFKVRGLRAMAQRHGTVPANPDNMRRALTQEDAALLVYPGGDHESYRPTWETDRVDFAGRTGFVKLAAELGVKIVPVVAIGGQETALFLGQGRKISAKTGLEDKTRIKVFPAQIAPPFGLTIL